MPKYMKVPLDWCRHHHGVREEDADFCDNAERCGVCGGTGFASDWDPCPACQGNGMEPCDLTPLLFEAAR